MSEDVECVVVVPDVEYVVAVPEEVESVTKVYVKGDTLIDVSPETESDVVV